MDSPKEQRFEVENYLERLRDAARLAGFQESTYGQVKNYPLRAYRRRVPEGQQALTSVYLSAGVHGDEPAGPLAVLKLLRDNRLDPRVEWHLVPLVNPHGMAAGRRENCQGVDLNRDYRALTTPEVARHVAWLQEYAPVGGYDLSLLLHEDWEAAGFYLYEVAGEANRIDLTAPMLAAAEPLVGVDQQEEIDGFPASKGVIRPLRDVEDFDPESREDLPEALLFYLHYSKINYTLETPSGKYLPDRVAAQAEAIAAAVQSFLEQLKK